MSLLRDDTTLIQKKKRTSLHILSQTPNRNYQQILTLKNYQQILTLKNNQRGSSLAAQQTPKYIQGIITLSVPTFWGNIQFSIVVFFKKSIWFLCF